MDIPCRGNSTQLFVYLVFYVQFSKTISEQVQLNCVTYVTVVCVHVDRSQVLCMFCLTSNRNKAILCDGLTPCRPINARKPT